MEKEYNEKTDQLDSLKTYIKVIEHEIKYLRTKPAPHKDEHINNALTILDHRIRGLKKQKDLLEYNELKNKQR